MKNLENMYALNEMDIVRVVGGDDDDDDRTIVDVFVDWLLSPPRLDGTGRPLPFPQDRRGNNAPFAPIQKTQGNPEDPLNTNPFDFPFV